MEAGIISLRYARAIYEYAVEEGVEELVYNDMSQLISNFKAFPKLRMLMNNPVFPLPDKINVLTSACGMSITGVTKDAIRLITKNKRNNYMEIIARKYTEIYREEKGIKYARITTDRPISEKTREELEKIVMQYVECRCVEFNISVNPDIIGGFILEVDDMLLNASIKQQLTELKLKLME